MQKVRIANVLLEETRQYRTAPALYLRTTCTAEEAEEGWRLSGPGTFDFTTFFNGLSVIKYDRYTTARSYSLHLELKGVAARVTQTCVDTYDYYSRPQEKTRVEVAASDEWVPVDIELSYAPTDVIVGFVIEAEGEVLLRNGYYAASVEDGAVREVELALSTTTFKKESYITHNIDLVRDQILGGDEAISGHFRMYVIDNGRTLDAAALSGDGVTVYPNRNVGGAGGFAYGMLLAQEQGVTHILMMDDDVEVSPESIKRTYNLLTIVNDEYADAFVSGAMMNYDEPDIHWEDLGFMTYNGIYKSLKPVSRLSILHDCATCEAFEPAEDLYPDTKQRYAAWWYCCFPVSTIRESGMPLPLFVRFDDAEYSLRVKPRFMTLNGICIWHLAFFMRYNAAQERYQTARNGLVGQAVTGVAPETNFFVELELSMRKELCKFNYDDAELICEGLEDYLRGPEWFAQKDVAERRFMDANRNKERLLPLDELAGLAKEVGVDFDRLRADDFFRDLPLGGQGPAGRLSSAFNRRLFESSLNGQLFGDLKPIEGKVALVEATGWSYPMGALFGVDTVVAVNIQLKAGVIRHRDNERGKALWQRYQQDVKRCQSEGPELKRRYAAARPLLTSVDYWRRYLDLD